MPDPNQGGLFDRVGNLVELLTTFDVRITNALEGLEEMRTSVTGLDPVREDAEALVSDLRKRLDVADARLHRDLDDIKALLMEKLGELDVTDLGPRFDRLEAAIFNIERATVNLNHSVEGSMEALPDFVARRVKGQVRQKKAESTEPPLTHDDLGH
jgi:hypothetical protein